MIRRIKNRQSFLDKLAVPGTIVYFKLPGNLMKRTFGYRIFKTTPESTDPPRALAQHSNVYNLENGYAMVIGEDGPKHVERNSPDFKTGYVKLLIQGQLFWVALEHISDTE